MKEEYERHMAFYRMKRDLYMLRNQRLFIDWAKGSGYSRGDIIKKSGNVIHVRFRTV